MERPSPSSVDGLPPLATRVHAELMAIRGTREGWTRASAALYPNLCAVLAGGDPSAAFAALRIAVLQLIDSDDVVAAAASLGLTTDSPTHTQRLDDAGEDLSREGRQVRRLSDRGLVTIARFVATNWNQAAVPRLEVLLIRTGRETCDVMVSTHALREIEMVRPTITINDAIQTVELTGRSVDGQVFEHLEQPLAAKGLVTSLHVQWRGELWPRMSLKTVGIFTEVAVTTLGNSLRATVVLDALDVEGGV
jgi:hypothetical protein